MSEVLRYRFVDNNGYPATKLVDTCQAERFVSGSDYDAAQSELAALREELATSERDRLAAERRYEEQVHARDQIATNYNQLSYGAGICKENLASTQQRLADAERRNAEARRLLDIASVRMATWLTFKESPRAEIINFLTMEAEAK